MRAVKNPFIIRRPLITERHLRLTYLKHRPDIAGISLQLALRSPFGLTLSSAIPPSAALSSTGGKAYLLSFNGLAQHSTDVAKWQVEILNGA